MKITQLYILPKFPPKWKKKKKRQKHNVQKLYDFKVKTWSVCTLAHTLCVFVLGHIQNVNVIKVKKCFSRWLVEEIPGKLCKYTIIIISITCVDITIYIHIYIQVHFVIVITYPLIYNCKKITTHQHKTPKENCIIFVF